MLTLWYGHLPGSWGGRDGARARTVGICAISPAYPRSLTGTPGAFDAMTTMQHSVLGLPALELNPATWWITKSRDRLIATATVKSILHPLAGSFCLMKRAQPKRNQDCCA